MNKVFIILAGIFAATACTSTITRGKPPVFTEPMDSLGSRLGQFVTCQHFSVKGREVTTDGKKKTELELDVINGQDIPEGDSMVALSWRLGFETKRALKDTGEYDEYKVLFFKVKESGGLTTRSYKGRIFKSSDLQ